MVNDDIDAETIDEDIGLEISQFSSLLLLYMTEDTQNGFDFHRRAVKTHGMAIKCDVFDVCGREILLEATKFCTRSSFPNCVGKNDEEIVYRAIQFYPENNLFSNYKCYIIRNRKVRKQFQFYKLCVFSDKKKYCVLLRTNV